MLEVLKAIILGIIQGLTEFLPVSSSGHLEIANYIFGSNELFESNMIMTVVLHFATALATIAVFKNDIVQLITSAFKRDKKSLSFIAFIVLSMLPAAIVGILFEDQIESLFSSNLVLVGGMLFITGILLLVADFTESKLKKLNPTNAIIVGIAQAIAILPGISRSGATISSSLLLGLDRTEATRFSFLMVIPLIFGKMFLDLIQGDFTGASINIMPLLAGFIAAFITGYLACIWMIKLVKKAKLRYFAIYCFIISIISVSYIWMK